MGYRVFVGIGFGAIQGGLFLYEAFRSQHFDRLVVGEIRPEVVESVRDCGGRYCVNVATHDGIEIQEVTGVEIYNPLIAEDRGKFIEAIAQASEIATALPSVTFYTDGDAPVATLLAEGIGRKIADPALPHAVVYTAENHNHAAELLQEAVGKILGLGEGSLADRVEFLNTVIGKMSGIVTDRQRIVSEGLEPLVEGLDYAFLVEAFNRILISAIKLPDFTRGIATFTEKSDLLPFEEAKLYGHNAAHALLGYLAIQHGYEYITESKNHEELIQFVREAFLEESGRALIQRHEGVDRLFTIEGFRAYADDLLDRMLNPYLHDTVERVTRDPLRKLAWNDRLIGTMRLVDRYGILPLRFARGAAAALEYLEKIYPGFDGMQRVLPLWQEAGASAQEIDRIRALVRQV